MVNKTTGKGSRPFYSSRYTVRSIASTLTREAFLELKKETNQIKFKKKNLCNMQFKKIIFTYFLFLFKNYVFLVVFRPVFSLSTLLHSLPLFYLL